MTCVSRSAPTAGDTLKASAAMIGNPIFSDIIAVLLCVSVFTLGAWLSKDPEKPQQNQQAHRNSEQPQDHAFAHGSHVVPPFDSTSRTFRRAIVSAKALA
jgi:hypothetical protein